MSDLARTAVLQNVRALVELLQKHVPFNQMAEGDVAWLVEHCSLAFFAQDEIILDPERGPVENFYILKQGLIRGERQVGRTDKLQITFEISPGECFPLAALLGERATRTIHRAAEDCFCLVLPKTHFVRMFARSAPFREFCVRGVSSLLEQVNQQVQLGAVQTLGAQHSLDTPLRELVHREPVICLPGTAVRDAVKMMHERGVGSIVVVDLREQPQGIFTLRDLRRFAAEPDSDFQTAVEKVMTVKPVSVSPNASAFDAALLMARYHIAHVLLVENSRLMGVVSERDLFALQRVDLVHLARTMANAPTVASLAALRTDVHRLIDAMLAHGAAALQLNRIITLLNDHTVQRVIELAIEEQGDPGFEFCWLAFGSEARREQTLHTDQDNGILFAAESAQEANDKRTRLLPLAKQINVALDLCGFTTCKGNIMAGNPELCRSEEEWKLWFKQFIRSATPANLLKSSVFFDIRAVWGQTDRLQPMFADVLNVVQGNTLFQRMLAENALSFRPPLGMFRNFVYSKGRGEKHSIDLKLQGINPFIAAARVLALANGLAEPNSMQRLKMLAEKELLDRKDVNAWEEAYSVIQLLRMRHHQAQLRENAPLTNRIDPDHLNQLDRRILKESFRQAQRLQQKLELQYQL